MTSQSLTYFEKSVLDKLLAGDDPVLEALRGQMRSCRVVGRTFTGCGFFTDLQVEPSVPAAEVPGGTLRIGDVSAKIKGLLHGAGFVLFVENGYLAFLEGYSYDEPWPEVVDTFELHYDGTLRDVS